MHSPKDRQTPRGWDDPPVDDKNSACRLCIILLKGQACFWCGSIDMRLPCLISQNHQSPIYFRWNDALSQRSANSKRMGWSPCRWCWCWPACCCEAAALLVVFVTVGLEPGERGVTSLVEKKSCKNESCVASGIDKNSSMLEEEIMESWFRTWLFLPVFIADRLCGSITWDRQWLGTRGGAAYIIEDDGSHFYARFNL